jgi:small subunit ribosomal protein S8
MINDLISDMLTRIRNASLAKHSLTRVNYSRLNFAILKVLLAENYIQKFELEREGKKLSIRILLKYKGWWIKKPLFSTIQIVSKPGKRVFCSYKKFDTLIDTLRYEQGIAIISTSSGVMSHLKAKKFKKGGEVLCYIG